MTDVVIGGPAAALRIPHRFRGPASSGNGGWTAGAVAELLPPGAVTVALRRPPPLDVDLDLEVTETGAVLRDGEHLIAEARPADGAPRPVPGVDLEEAHAAETGYPGLRFHPFPSCFACGTERDAGDGLRIFPGRVTDSPDGAVRTAATWTPHPSVAEDDVASVPITWAALDCIGGWAGDLTERLMVLGSMTAVVGVPPRIGETHVVVGEDRGSEGRKTRTASTLYDPAGRAIAVAEHVWIAVDPADFS